MIAPGWTGSNVTVTLKVLAGLEPHELLAVTDIVPPVAPATAVIDVDAEVPVQPDGNVQV